MGLVAQHHVGSSQIRDPTHVSCTGRQILYHWATREAPTDDIFKETWKTSMSIFKLGFLWITVLYPWNFYNIVNQLYLNKKIKKSISDSDKEDLSWDTGVRRSGFKPWFCPSLGTWNRLSHYTFLGFISLTVLKYYAVLYVEPGPPLTSLVTLTSHLTHSLLSWEAMTINGGYSKPWVGTYNKIWLRLVFRDNKLFLSWERKNIS